MTPRGTRRLLLACLLLAVPGQAPAEAGAPSGPGFDVTSAASAELEGFLDGLFRGLMETHHIPGAVAVLVRDGAVVFARGYGVADVQTRRPVEPDRTRFRVASVSKLFTTTAVLQQVERGALDLDADVNGYLESWRLEGTYDAPVTLRHLLTHTGGFDDRFLFTAEPLDGPATPLGEYLAARMPPRVMPPGELISYSNHGLALAGYLVERASETPFARYVEREIFAPLGMSHSRFGIPTPVPSEMARPYEFRAGRHVDLGYDRLRGAPAGDLVTTGTDMARFMLAHLGGGRIGGATLLRPETAATMQRRQFTHHPELSGWCLGFAELERNGLRAITHGGSWRGFGTQLVLVPERSLGWFVSTNHDFHGPFFEALGEALWDRLGPTPTSAPLQSPADFRQRAARYEGTYLPNRRVRSDFLKLSALLMEVSVSLDDDGALRVAPGPLSNAPPRRLVEVGPERFATPDGNTQAAFETDATGRARRLFVESYALDRISAWESPRNHALVAVGVLLLLAASLLGEVIALLGRLLGGGEPSPAGPWARLTLWGVCLGGLGLIGGLGALARDPDIWTLMAEIPPRLRLLAWLPLLMSPFALALPVLVVTGFRAPAPRSRLHYAAVAVAGLLLLLGAWYWRLTPWGLA